MINTILGSLSTLFNQDNNPQVPKAITQPGQTPKIEQPDYLSTQQHISTIAPGAEQWGRKEWRQWRKQQGLSKQEMRNIRAQALVGTQAPRDVSRGDLKRIERNVKAQTPGMALYAVSGRDAGRKVNQVTDALGKITNWSGKVNTDPIEIEEEIIEESSNSKEQEYLELAQRLKAEFENYKKRNADVVLQSFDNGVAHTVEKLLPAIDSFKQAKNSIQDENVIKGLDLVLSQILNAFSELGVTKISAVGEQFDPNFHNAVMVDNNSDLEDNVIVDKDDVLDLINKFEKYEI